MVIIDRLCYNSKLRYVNAGEKFAFSVLTLIACVISRSIRISCLVLIMTGVLHRMEGGDPCFPLSSAADDSSGFPDFKHPCHCAESFGDADGSLCGSHRQRVSYGQPGFPCLCPEADPDGACQRLLPVFPVPEHSYAGHSQCPAPHPLPQADPELMLLIYRFIFVLFEISSAIRTAQNSRLGNRDYRTSMKSFSALVSALFIRAMKKSNALYDAMESRCYDGTIMCWMKPFRPGKGRFAGSCFLKQHCIFVWRRKRSFSKDRRTVLRGAFMEDIILKADDLYFSYEGEKSHSLNGLSLEIGRGKKINRYTYSQWFREIHVLSVLQRDPETLQRNALSGR